MDKIDIELLSQIDDDFHAIEQGSFNIRKNGESLKRVSNEDIQIVTKKNNSGIDIIINKNVQNKSVHIPVIVTKGGFADVVKNDFYVGENSSVLIVAGCGIHNSESSKSSHNGEHTFHIAKNAKVVYVEKHLGLGDGEKVLNPKTIIYMKENSSLEMQTVQLGGVSYSNRTTRATLKDNAKLVCVEKILTDEKQVAKTSFNINLQGKNSSVKVTSRSVAKGNSYQKFDSNVLGNNECFGHVECDGIIVDNAIIESAPKVCAKHNLASLVHEAAIGKIAGEQLIKLQTLGLTEQEAEEEIIKGFLK